MGDIDMIEPYYSDDHVTIYHGNCLELADRRGSTGRLVGADATVRGADVSAVRRITIWDRAGASCGWCGYELGHGDGAVELASDPPGMGDVFCGARCADAASTHHRLEARRG